MEFVEYFDGVFMYGNSNNSGDGDEWVFFFQLLFWSMAMSGSYLLCLCSRACLGNLSWQYANSMSWSVMDGEGALVGGSYCA